MNSFFDENVFLDNAVAKDLYAQVKDLPIFDYHCHLSPKEISENRVFTNIGELWLEGDHYKWRLMRAAGIDEQYITGDASFYDKFMAFATIVQKMAGNPIYHWLHLELKQYFGINIPLNAKTAQEIWEKTLIAMQDGSFSARKLIERSKVEAIFTTDDPADNLEYHKEIQDSEFPVLVAPTFRPDMAVCGISKPEFPQYIEKLSKAAKIKITDVEGLKIVLGHRINYFIRKGCCCSDISLTTLPTTLGNKDSAEKAFAQAMKGKIPSPELQSDFIAYMLRFLAQQYYGKNIAMQLHLSALRNNNKNLFDAVGADCGNDSIASAVSIEHFGALLNQMSLDGGLPKTIVYTLNPSNYAELATMIGNFWGKASGRLQLGAAWWFCDHLDGIREQLQVFAATGLLGTFNGMLTDSRSFTSYARHDFFRRILCSLVGSWVEKGEYDAESALELVSNICIHNVRSYFGKGETQ